MSVTRPLLPALAGPQPAVRLLDQLPQLTEHLRPADARLARSRVVAPAVQLAPGRCDEIASTVRGSRAFGAIVVSGLLTRHVDIGGHPGMCFYGPGDVLGTLADDHGGLPTSETWRATLPTSLAILDDRFLIAARHWPRLFSALVHQIQEQHDRLVIHLVIAQQPRVEARILTLFWHLAERFGRVTPDGVVLSVRLTHEAIGGLIGAQRPTVTLGLKLLRERGAIVRRPDRTWLITAGPDAALGLGSRPEPAVPVAIASVA
jgi:CRP-like cAMP-binding protein